MKINRMNMEKAKIALENAQKNCPGSAYYYHVKERIKYLTNK